MTRSVGCVLFNCEDVGLEEGRYEFEPLKAELAESPRVPALIKIRDHRMLTWEFEF